MTAALVEAGVRRDAGVALADEMRLGLRGQVRRVLAPRGVKVVQRLQLRDQWSCLLLAVDPRAATLRWRWLARCRADPIKDARAAWTPDAVVWDGHGAQTAKRLAALPIARIRLPAYSPELNPVERIFAEVRRHVEGRVYPSVTTKQEAVETDLTALADDPDRLRRLCGWAWLIAAISRTDWYYSDNLAPEEALGAAVGHRGADCGQSRHVHAARRDGGADRDALPASRDAAR